MKVFVKVVGIFLTFMFTLMGSSIVFSKEFYCSGVMEVSEGNTYLKNGKSTIGFGIEIFEKKVLFYSPSGEILELSLVNEGKYLETKNSVRASNNKFFINSFISKSETEKNTNNNLSGSYHTFHFDKKKQVASLTVQSWNHETKGDDYDNENFLYVVEGKCNIFE